MNTYYPDYYKQFRCIADRCMHSCCIGWRIGVDIDTYKSYASLTGDYRLEIINSIREDEDGYYIGLADGGRCPHLDESGLCRIISTYGESALCDICRLHPRFFNECDGVVYAGLSAACEAAAELILKGADYAALLTQDEGPVREGSVRMELYTIFSAISRSSSLSDAILALCAMYGIPENVIDESYFTGLLSGCEYINEESRRVFTAADKKPAVGCEKELKSYLNYLIYRYCTGAKDLPELRAALAFCLAAAKRIGAISGGGFDFVLENVRRFGEEIESSTDNIDYLIFDIDAEMI